MPLKKKADQKRGAAWSDGETRLLLSIWEEKSVEGNTHPNTFARV
jgi:hypothetical protein